MVKYLRIRHCICGDFGLTHGGPLGVVIKCRSCERQTKPYNHLKKALAAWNNQEDLMEKKDKGNGGDPDAAAQVEKQLEFLTEIKALAKKHGIDFGKAMAADEQRGPRQLNIQVREHKNTVLVDFGIKIRWMAMELDQAMKLAASIIKRVQSINKKTGIGAQGGEAEPEHYEDLVDERAEDPEQEKDEVDKPE